MEWTRNGRVQKVGQVQVVDTYMSHIWDYYKPTTIGQFALPVSCSKAVHLAEKWEYDYTMFV